MIFTAIGLLVAATVMLIIGITSTSIGALVVSVLLTLAAGGVLWGSFVQYRKEAGLVVPGYPQGYTGQPGVVVDLMGADGVVHGDGARANGAPISAPAAAVVPPGGAGAWAAVPTATVVRTAAEQAVLVPEGWDDLRGSQAVELIEALDLDELHAVRRHEIEGLARRNVLTAIDERIDRIVALRKKL